jgi:FMN phosphatase YigB (HAD superfamily)
MEQFLTDVDNCLLNWTEGFTSFTKLKHPDIVFDPSNYKLGLSESEMTELVEEFNSSPEFAKLKPYADALEIIPKLAALGYTFVAISTCNGRSLETPKLRKLGLESVFGKGIFSEFVCLPLGVSKLEALQRFKPTYWIDDKLSHSIDGAIAGHVSFNMVQPYNIQQEKPPNVIPVENWNEVYNIVISHSQA